MKTEFEAKFLNIDFTEIRERLNDLRAELEQPMRLMQRAILKTPKDKDKDSFVRVRDEGDKVTLTYKQFDSLSVDGAKEHEVVVSDLDETVNLLIAAGLDLISFQESRRETWRLEDVEIVLD